MDGRVIPGFYFDVEKQKYFKIQPGHRLPEHSRYATSSVQREARSRKRYERELQQHERSLISRPSLAGTLKHQGICGTILNRETGQSTQTQALVGTATALAASLRLTRSVAYDALPTLPAKLTGVYPLPDTDHLLVELDYYSFGEAKWDYLSMDQQLSYRPGSLYGDRSARQRHYHQYPHKASRQLYHLSLELIHGLTGGAVRYHYCNPQIHTNHRHNACHPVAGTINIGEMHVPNLIVDVRMQSRQRVALATLGQLISLDVQSESIETLYLKKEVSCVDWLSHNVMAAGQGKGVRLWDVRVRDSLTRIHHRKRVTRVVGERLDREGQLLVTDNHGLKLYDLRMTSNKHDRYPLEFHGVHEGPRALVDIGPAGLVAMCMDASVQVFSLSAGRRIASYNFPVASASLPTQLAWHEDARGSPYLQLCHNHWLSRWSIREPLC